MVRVSGPGVFLSATLFSASLLAQPVAGEPAPAPPAASYPSDPGAGEPPPPPPGGPPPAAYTAPESQPVDPAQPPPGQPPPAAQPPPGQPPPPGYAPPPAGYGYPPYEPPPPEEPKETPRDVSITISPLHLLLPVIEAQVEARIYPHFSLSLIAGYGSVTLHSNDPSIDGTALDVLELGGQITGYPLKDFKSLQLGAEILWLRVSGENVGDTGIAAVVDGTAVGPFVGYKVLTSGGFTFAIQGGFERIILKGEASDDTGTTETAQDQDWVLLLNANLGWSF